MNLFNTILVLIFWTALLLLSVYSCYFAYKFCQEKRKTARLMRRQNETIARRPVNDYVSSVLISLSPRPSSDGSFLNPPPSYEYIQPPPSYEEVMRIHGPVYQNQQPTVQPIAASLAHSATNERTDQRQQNQ